MRLVKFLTFTAIILVAVQVNINAITYEGNNLVILKSDDKQISTIKTGEQNEFKEITLGVVSSLHDSTICLMNSVAQSIAKEMDVQITLKPLPAKRIIKMLKRGDIHGDFSRLEGYLKTVPEALKVEAPVVQIHYFAYASKLKNITVTDWDSLKNYKIALPRGYSVYKGYLNEHQIYFLNSYVSAFEFVNAGRADLLVLDTITANQIIKNHAPDFNNIQKVGSSLGRMNFHTYISPKYPKIVKLYNEALKRLISTPSYPKLFSENTCN